MNNFLNGKSAAMMLALSLVNVTAAFAQDDNSSAKEEGNRNVMLNAASANGPREIQIGLPSADVNVLENGLPVTYATNPHSVNTIWRGDASLSHQGLLKIAETAITTGNIGYAVNSFTQKGQKGFNGTLNYKSNHFGLQEFSLNMNGDLGKDWYYSFNMYQDFDPGTFKIKSTPYQAVLKFTRLSSPRSITATVVSSLPCISMPTAITCITTLPRVLHLSMWAMEA